MEVKADNKKLARFIASAIGFEPHVNGYWDEENKNCLDILSLLDPIDENVCFYCTIGLSDYENPIEMKDGQYQNIPVELLITGYRQYDMLPNVLSTCGFYIAKDKWTCQPNDIFKSLVETYYPEKEIKHVFFDSPFLWEDKLGEGLQLDTKDVHFLLCIPITEKEFEFKMKNGSEALRNLFAKNEIDVFDLDRKSVV